MQSPIIHQQLILSSERVRDLHRLMQAHSSAIPAAEMEIFLAEIRKLYELALQLNYQNALQLLTEMQNSTIMEMKMNYPTSTPVISFPEIAPVSNQKPPLVDSPISKEQAPDLTTPVKEVPNTPIASVPSEPIRKEQMSDVPVEIPSTSQSTFSMDKLMADISKAEAANENNQHKRSNSDLHEMFASAPSIAHKFEDHETLADRIALKQSAHSVSDHLHKIPVKDIKASIGLNEKFQFINQLFNGDSQKYNASVDHLNSCGSAGNAQEYMKNISLEYNWEKQPSIASLFMDIVERRFLG